jgi:hypothetical protein
MRRLEARYAMMFKKLAVVVADSAADGKTGATS